MSAFRFLSFLIRLPLALIFIPLRFIGVPLAVLMIPVRIIMHNFVLIFIIVATILIYRAFEHSNGPDRMIQPAAPSAKEANPAGKPGQVDPVSRHENGDSAFATDLYASMTDAERRYYSTMFYSVMDNVPDGSAHVWQAVNIAGNLTPTQSFQNNDGRTCRRFKEVLKVHRVEQTLSGIACERVEGGWCKLRVGATPACGLSSSHGGGVLDVLKGLF